MALLRKLSKCQFIVNFIEYYAGINETCIVTEYLGGSDLFNTIAHPTFQLNENKCKVITGQILEALSFIHSIKIVHMDIKGRDMQTFTEFPKESRKENIFVN